MAEQQTPNMTPVDALLCDESIQAMKACIPFLGMREQPLMLAFAKFLEFRHSLRLIREDSGQLAACSMEPALRTPVHMLNCVKTYLGEGQRRTVDTILSYFQMIQFYQAFQGPAADAQPSAEYAKAMLSPEQERLFREFSETVQLEHQPKGESYGQ